MDEPGRAGAPPQVDLGAGLGARLAIWAAEARIDDQAQRRSRARWLAELAEQDAHLGGVLLDLAERRTQTAFRLAGGRRTTGEIEVVGADFSAVRTRAAVALIPNGAIAALRPAPGRGEVVGDRVVATDVRFVEVLRELSVDREPVRVALSDGGEVLTGTLRRVGVDVLALRVDGDQPATVHVPVASVVEVALG